MVKKQQNRMRLTLSADDKLSPVLKGLTKKLQDTSPNLKKFGDEMRALNRKAKSVEGFTKQKVKLVDLGKTWKASQERVKKLSIEMKKTKKPTKQMADSFVKAKKRAKELKKSFDENNKVLQEQRNGLSKLALSTTNLAEQTRKLKSEKSSLLPILQKELDKTKKLSEETKKFKYKGRSKLGKWANASIVGMAASHVGQGVSSGVGGVVGTGMDFNAMMSRVSAKASRGVSDKERQKQLAELKIEAKRLGSSTSFSSTQIASGMDALAMGGADKTGIIKATEGLLDIAKAGDVDLAQATSISMGILKQYKMKMGEITTVGDVLSQSASSSNTNISEMGEAFKYVGGVASGLGLSLSRTAGYVTALADVNIRGSEAGTALRTSLSRLAAPSMEAATELAKMNVETTKIVDGRRVLRNTNDVLFDLAKATKDWGNADKQAAVNRIFGMEASTGALRLMDVAYQEFAKKDGTKGIRNGLDDLEKKTNKAKGSSKKAGKIISDNLTGDVTKLSSAWEGVKLAVSDALDPILRFGAQTFTPLLQGLVNVINQFPKITLGVGSAVTALGFLVKGTIFRFVLRLGKGLLGLGDKATGAAPKIGIFRKALFTLAKPFKWLFSMLGRVSSRFKSLFGIVSKFKFKSIVGAVKGLLGPSALKVGSALGGLGSKLTGKLGGKLLRKVALKVIPGVGAASLLGDAYDASKWALGTEAGQNIINTIASPFTSSVPVPVPAAMGIDGGKGATTRPVTVTNHIAINGSNLDQEGLVDTLIRKLEESYKQAKEGRLF